MENKWLNGVEIPGDITRMSTSTRQEIYQLLIESIDIRGEEVYDCRTLNVWSYRKAEDIREGIAIKFGNMVNGFPFKMNGHSFHNSECAYIAGAYACNDETSIWIQKQIAQERNGHACKMIYRKSKKYAESIRSDFATYNVEWMIYVVWQKCKNPDFAELLKQVPVDAHIVENTTLHKGNTTVFWGAKNKELMEKRLEKEREVEQQQNFRFKKDLRQAQNKAANTVTPTGSFTGQNVMGKIIKLCSLALIFEQYPKIDYEVLNKADLYLMGEKLTF